MGAYPGIKATANGPTAPLPINMLRSFSPFLSPTPSWSLGLIATVSPGANLTYTVEITADPNPSANGNWNSHDILVGQTVSANSNIAYPASGVRLNIANYISGSTNLGVAQWP
jgi:hypothetical protein